MGLNSRLSASKPRKVAEFELLGVMFLILLGVSDPPFSLQEKRVLFELLRLPTVRYFSSFWGLFPCYKAIKIVTTIGARAATA